MVHENKNKKLTGKIYRADMFTNCLHLAFPWLCHGMNNEQPANSTTWLVYICQGAIDLLSHDWNIVTTNLFSFQF